MESLAAYIPMDRRQAVARGEDLPDRADGAVLSADIIGFTPLAETLVHELGARRGAEELTRQLNLLFDALVVEVHRYQGSVVGFSGDAITCWFDGDRGSRALDSALAMQQASAQLTPLNIPSGASLSLGIKIAVVSGPARRFLVGAPAIQLIDVLAGSTLERLAAAEAQAREGEIIVGPEIVSRLGDRVVLHGWRVGAEMGEQFAIVGGMPSHPERHPPAALSPAELTEEQMRPWLLPPVFERFKAGQEQFLAEIRPAVPLFLRFSGLDYDGDDAAGEKLDAYIGWVQGILDHHGGYLIQVTVGDKGSYLYAVFGAPLAHDDDPARAVAAAMELQSPPPALSFVTTTQIGISQGRMRVGAYGSPRRRTYGVLGDETNVASRLMTRAQPGQILISKRIADAVGARYRLTDLGSVELKGKQEPIPVFSLLRGRASTALHLADRPITPLIGRDAELAQLEQALDAAQAGKAQILRLEGAAGIGKSRLAVELLERARRRGFSVAVGASQVASRDIIFYPWQQIFRVLFELDEEPSSPEERIRWADQQIGKVTSTVESMDPEWLGRLPLLGDLLALSIPDNEITSAFDRKLRQDALFSLLAGMIATWARVQPMLLLVDDAHWQDEASRALTLALARALAQSPILLAVIHRPSTHEEDILLPELAQFSGYGHLELDELLPPDMGELVTELLSGNPVSALLLSTVQTLVQGNPFFAEELVSEWRETKRIRHRDDGTWALSEATFDALLRANCLTRDAGSGQWMLSSDAPLSAADLGLPESTHAAALARFDRLPEAHKTTLKAASAIGFTFESDLLALCHPLQPDSAAVEQHLEALRERDRIHLVRLLPRRVYAFRHPIAQEVVYDTLLEEQRRQIHQAVGEALEALRPEEVERLAYHYSRSDVRDKTLVYLDEAARKAQREYANETALNFYDQALALEERWQWLRGRVGALHVLGRREQEQTSLRALEAFPAAPPGKVQFLWGQHFEATGEFSRAQECIEQALVAFQDTHDQVSQARCLAQLGLLARRKADYDRAKEKYGEALQLLQEAYPDEEIQALNGLGTVYRAQGDWAQAMTCYERALALSVAGGNRFGEAEACHFLGGVAFYQSKYDEALTYYRKALEIRRVIGDWAGEGAGLCSLAQIASSVGDYSEAQHYLDEALRIQRATGNRYEQVNVWNELGVLHLFLGNLARSQSCLQEALAISQEIGDEQGEAYILGNLALVMRDQRELDEAERLLSDGLALAQAQEDEFLISIFLSHLGIVNLRAGRLKQAIDLSQEALALRHKLELGAWATADLANLAAAHLASGDIEQALDYARQALKILDDGGAKEAEYPEQDYFICYQVLAEADQDAAAQTALQSAYDLVMARADQITNPALRQGFLQEVGIHRTIVSEYERRQGQRN